ncbi:hypothetical protein COOONC_07309 [Cooperia oncophora]
MRNEKNEELFPGVLNKKRPSDGVHWHLIRIIGNYFFVTAFISCNFRSSSCATHTLCFLIRIIALHCYLITELVTVSNSWMLSRLCWSSLAYVSKMDTGSTGRDPACLGIISAQLWSQSAYPDFWSRGHWIGITLSATWCLVSIAYRIALFYTTKIKTV